MVIIGDTQKKIEIVEQSIGISTGSFTAEDMLRMSKFLSDHTFQCPICRKIRFPEVGINRNGEVYMIHSEVNVQGLSDGVREFLPKRACSECKPKLSKMADKLNVILAKIAKQG